MTPIQRMVEKVRTVYMAALRPGVDVNSNGMLAIWSMLIEQLPGDAFRGYDVQVTDSFPKEEKWNQKN